ncbi:PKD domain-containing protein [Flavobacterium sp. 83]|uniref:PKD domain-containing protein n=1 Tax=Flavobacterium sp. 83 TaxID=1131812 RepID=UPI00068D2460|nr:PKD domain-containing protein [Flavobacterium sp. 83]
MKHLYKIIFLFILIISVNNLNAKSNHLHFGLDKIIIKEEVNNLVLPTATITTNDASVCVGGIAPIITFTGIGGTAPYTFTYKIGTGGNQTIVTTSGNSVSVSAPTSAVDSFVYTLISVHDTANPTIEQTSTSSATVTVNALPAVPIIISSGTTTFCEGKNIVLSTSNVSGLNYQWNLNNIAIPNATSNNYTATSSGNYTITVTNSNGCISTSQSIVVNVYSKIDPVLGANGSTTSVTFQNTLYFTRCITSPTGIINIVNETLNQSQVSSYTLNWGDASPILNLTSFATNLTHTYNQGFYTLNISLTTNQGCVYSKNYGIFVGNTPSGSLGNPGNLSGCSPKTIDFPIIAPAGNVPGTQYIIDFGDGQSITYIHPNAPSSVSHTYNTSSCGNNPTGSGSIPNSFVASMTITNPCFPPAFTTVGPIIVNTPPTPSFTIFPNPGCVNTTVNILNTSNSGSIIGQNGCVSSPSLYWVISPATGWNATGLGSKGGNANDIDSWNNGVNAPSINFNTIGNYSITLFIGNSCDIKSITKTICIEPALTTPTISLMPANASNCAPLSVNASTPNVVSNCVTPIQYLWTVTHTDLDCDVLASDPTYLNSTTSASQNPLFNFTAPGNYSIQLQMTNSCGMVQSIMQTLIVKKPPVASVDPIANLCGGSSGTTIISPTANVKNCGFATSELVYNWSFPGGTPVTSSQLAPQVTYATGGSKTVSLFISTANGCANSVTSTQTFAIGTAPTLGTLSPATQTICSGSTTTVLPLTAQSGTTFSWSATTIPAGVSVNPSSGNANSIPALTISNSNNQPKMVTLTIISTLNGCPSTNTYDIIINPAPTITQPTGSTICSGGIATPLSVSITPTPVSGNTTYKWYSNTTGDTNSNTSTLVNTSTIDGNYTPPSTLGTIYYFCEVTFSSSGSCPNIKSNAVPIIVNAGVTINTQPTATQNLCVGGSIPLPLSVTATGGTGTLTYQWYSNTTNSTIGATPVGTNSSTYALPVFNAIGTFYYYAIVSANGNGCGTATSTFSEVVVIADPSITVQPLVTQTQCRNSAATSLIVTATDGIGIFNYQWYSTSNPINTGGNPVGINSSSYLPPTDVVGTFYYYCLVSQSGLGCSIKSNIATVVVVTAPQITINPQSAAVCGVGTLAPLTVAFSNGTGTATYQWYDDNGPKSGATIDTYRPTNTVTTSYYCIITFSSGGCTSITSDKAIITINPQPTISTQPLTTQNSCVGGTISSPLSVTSSGGTGTPSYQWYSTTNNSPTGGTQVGTNSATYTPPALTIVQTYNYYVVITYSGGGCNSITSNLAQIVVVNDPTVITQPLTTQTVCQNSNATVLSVAASGGLGSNYSYQWFSSISNSNIGGFLILGEINNTFLPPTSNVGTLYYYCVIKQPTGTGCNTTSVTAMVTVNLAPAFTTTLVSSDICLGQIPSQLKVVTNSDALSPIYQWYYNPNNLNSGGTLLSGETNAAFNPPASAAGTQYYYCVVTFSSITGNCSEIISSPVKVIINQPPVVFNKTAIICSGNSFTVLPVNSGLEIVPIGTTYTWTNPTINPPNSITGASAQSIPQTNISQTLINSTTSPATVIYTVTPLSGVCMGHSFTVIVTVNPAISAIVNSNNSTCFGINNGTIQTNITGGIPFSSGVPYQISWNGPNGFASSASSISNLVPGDYTLSITDAGGCPITNTYTISEPNDISIATDLEKDVTCFNEANGAIAITITGGTLGYTFAWTKNGIAFATTKDLTNLNPGIYVVTVSDTNNCSPKTATFTITEPPILAVNLVNQNNILCFGQPTGTITVNVVGGTLPYTYSWTGPNGVTSSNQNLTNVLAGTYNLLVTDNLGCIKTLSVTLTQPTAILITATTSPIICYGGNDASITLSITGGIAPYKIVWNTLASGLFQDNLSAGDYLITVTDANNCVKTLNVNIPEAPIFTINPVVKQISCFGMNDGSINLNLVGGITPLRLVWSDGSAAGLTRNNLGPGSYTVTIIDSKPCTIISTFIIQEPQKLILSANVIHAFDCDDANSGAINLLVAGGTPPFTYSWSNGALTEDLSNIPAGNYLISVIDSRACSITAQYVINRQPPIVIGVETKTDFNCETKYVKQTFVAQVSGGVPPYQLVWSSGTVSGLNNEMMNTNQNGTSILYVTDNMGCKANYTFNVDLPILGMPSFSPSSYGYTTYGTYSINDPIQFTNSATGDFVSVTWDFGDGTFSSEQNPIHTFINPKDYVVTQTVTYPFGCIYTQKITFIVGKGYLLVVPNAFTPNNDNLNDTFRPVTKALKNVRLDIYDTWGSLIYSETGAILRGWDAKIKGFNAENGNYYCKVSGETFYGTIVNENHPFVLIK